MPKRNREERLAHNAAVQRAWYAKNRSRVRAKERERENTPEFAEKRRARLLKHRYQISPIQYERIFQNQNGVCGICGNPEDVLDPATKRVRRLSVDHNHKTGEVRGLLCTRCNSAIGKLKDNYKLLLRAVEYLKPCDIHIYRAVYLHRKKVA
jgi:hypothetical protein